MKNNEIFKLCSYDYILPASLIASSPTLPKEDGRLLVFDKKSKEISHHTFKDLKKILPDCAIIFNDTKVVKARIFGNKDSGGKIELLLNSYLGDNKFSCLIKGNVKIGTKLNFELGLQVLILELKEDGSRIVSFNILDKELNADELYEMLSKIGHVPLPPYIKRSDIKDDETWYQSVFAKNSGAVAAPTASLHFTKEMIEDISKNHELYYLTLHVGAGTFLGVQNDDIREHKIHSEFYTIPQKTANLINSKTKILGIGTTVTRCVEYYFTTKKLNGFCDLFLHPNNPPMRQDFLLTNFHLPKSTLIMLVAAFIGLQDTMKIYKIAVEKKYKFYSYGDAMIII